MYICECGKEFEKPNSFNAHKSNCKAHYVAKYGSEKEWNEIKAKRSKNSTKTFQNNFEKRKVEELNIWISEQHTCEKCHKIMTKWYGSGRFCSQSCANSNRAKRNLKKQIKSTIKYTCSCQYCEKQFVKTTAKDRHEKYCDLNPNRPPKATYHKYKLDKSVDFYRIGGPQSMLVNTIEDVENYISEHLTCEICGKTVEETVKWESKNAPKRLCVDHDHETMQFRGVLCSVCNRQLGWYEANKEAINKYLEKDFPLENKSK